MQLHSICKVTALAVQERLKRRPDHLLTKLSQPLIHIASVIVLLYLQTSCVSFDKRHLSLQTSCFSFDKRHLSLRQNAKHKPHAKVRTGERNKAASFKSLGMTPSGLAVAIFREPENFYHNGSAMPPAMVSTWMSKSTHKPRAAHCCTKTSSTPPTVLPCKQPRPDLERRRVPTLHSSITALQLLARATMRACFILCILFLYSWRLWTSHIDDI